MNPNLWFAYGCVLGVLVIGSLYSFFLVRKHPDRDYRNLCLRIKTWWIIAPLLILSVTLGNIAISILFMLVSLLAMQEFTKLQTYQGQNIPNFLWGLLYPVIALQYFLAIKAPLFLFVSFIPCYALLVWIIGFSIYTNDTSKKKIALLCYGLILSTYCLSHLARLGSLDHSLSLIVFLLVISQLNDVSQYVWGKLFGKRQLAPIISPNKTIEGLLGGIITSAFLAFLLGPVLLNTSKLISPLIGLALSISGTIGDLLISWFKRQAAVKDTGTLLPGHGGILDRIDGLMLASPVFYYIMLLYQNTLETI